VENTKHCLQQPKQQGLSSQEQVALDWLITKNQTSAHSKAINL
jgi:hypothetical protein